MGWKVVLRDLYSFPFLFRRLLETNNGRTLKLLEVEIRQLCSASFLISACSYYLAFVLVLCVFD